MTQTNRRPHIIVFSIGGLNTLWLGCYGNTSVSTPGLDRLALRSIVFDQYYTNTSRVDLLYSSFLQGIHPATVSGQNQTADCQPHKEASSVTSLLTSSGYRTVLLTDDTPDALGPLRDSFDEVAEMDEEESSCAVDSYEETRFCRYFEEAIRLLSESQEDDAEETPLFLWCRFKGFFGSWDFPQEERIDEQEDEEDPEPYAGTSVPFCEEKGDLYSKDDYRLRPEIIRDHDALLSYLQTWKAGLAILDTAISDFLDFLRETGMDKDTILVFTSEQGFPLGEHGRVGQRQHPTSRLLYPEEFHCPLMIQLPNFTELAFRTSLLCGPTDLYLILTQFASKENTNTTTLNTPFLQAVLDEKETFHDHLLFVENDANSINRSVITENWLFRQTSLDRASDKQSNGVYRGEPVLYEVYTLPDDRFCVNNVSSRTEQEQTELVALLDQV
ncbi:MAG: sulfatase-like hydrolase/transferase [Thermoguttaceae bacterium]|nr:sulfatase-like hydrolase/transferase [Thermoguttaceae bacterium]